MDLPVSQKVTKLSRQFKLSPEEMAFADLCAVGWEPEDAWAIALRKGFTWKKSQFRDEVAQLRDKDQVKERIDNVRAVLRTKQVEKVKKATNNERQNVITQALSKEQMLFDLQTALTGMAIGSKEWLDTKKLIIDVTRMKQDEVKEEDNTIHYFLPVHYPTGCEDCLYSRCESCKFKKAYKEVD